MSDNTTPKIDFQQLINQQEFVLVYFYASWCYPCQKLTPVLDECFAKNKNISLVKIDIDQHPEITKENKVNTFPTLVFYKNRKEIKRRIGYCSSEELKSFLENNA
ncbi:MAG: thioredoxin family protein [Candidatus Phytoplasma pruni]|uniref:thioredoxin family protein n=1 Tax=Milkweed yellows phytoplasma TaxID=208434 RepID=UPI00036F35EA|nr:thioredoxin family protein [Milkweed yellows phytoplasma]